MEPNYKGRLFGLLLNFSDKDISIPRYARLLSIEFNYLYSPIVPIEDDKHIYDSLADFLRKNSSYVQGTLEAFLTKINSTYQNTLGIQKKMQYSLDELDVKKTKARSLGITLTLSIAAILLTFMMPFLSVYITKQTIDKDDYPFERIINLEREKDSLKTVNEKLKEELFFINHKVDSLYELYKNRLETFSGKKVKKNGKS